MQWGSELTCLHILVFRKYDVYYHLGGTSDILLQATNRPTSLDKKFTQIIVVHAHAHREVSRIHPLVTMNVWIFLNLN